MNNIGNPDLIQTQFELSRQCDEKIRELGRLGEAYAQAQYNYCVQKTQTALKLKANGESATLIMTVLKGYPKVSKLMLERDIAKSRWEACRESINILKLQIRTTESQISREWGRNE